MSDKLYNNIRGYIRDLSHFIADEAHLLLDNTNKRVYYCPVAMDERTANMVDGQLRYRNLWMKPSNVEGYYKVCNIPKY